MMQSSKTQLAYLLIGAGIGGIVGCATAYFHVENSSHASPLSPVGLLLAKLAYVAIGTLVMSITGGILGVAVQRMSACIRLGQTQQLLKKAAVYAVVSPLIPILRGSRDIADVIQLAVLGSIIGLVVAALSSRHAPSEFVAPRSLPPT